MNKNEVLIQAKKPFVDFLRFKTPTVYSGSGALGKVVDLLEEKQIKNVFILSSTSVYKNGLLNSLFVGLSQKGISYTLGTGVPSNPDYDSVMEAVAEFGDSEAIVAIGGGSVLDAAKAIGGCVTAQKSVEELVGMFHIRKPLPFFIAVPTTAGTGSEATLAAVISDYSHNKKQILDPVLIPDVAILDSALTKDLPVSLTAYCGMDALTHALEAYTSLYARNATNRYARRAIRIIFDTLPSLMKEPENLEYRQDMLEASFFAGYAFTRVYIGYVHAFGHAIGGIYNEHHGLCMAILLPEVMRFYEDVCVNEFATLAQDIGIYDIEKSNDENAKRFVDEIFKLNQELGIPSYFTSLKEDDYDEIIEKAFKECHGNYPVPKYYSYDEAISLLRKVSLKNGN